MRMKYEEQLKHFKDEIENIALKMTVMAQEREDMGVQTSKRVLSII